MFACFLLTCGLTPASFAESVALATSGKPTYAPAQSGPRPVWSGGAFLKVENNESASPEILTYDEQGRVLSSTTFSIPGASLVHIKGFARAKDGTSAIGGFSNSADGRNAAFFAWITTDGETANMTRCEPFYPVKLAIGPDGTLWTVGYVNSIARCRIPTRAEE